MITTWHVHVVGILWGWWWCMVIIVVLLWIHISIWSIWEFNIDSVCLGPVLHHMTIPTFTKGTRTMVLFLTSTMTWSSTIVICRLWIGGTIVIFLAILSIIIAIFVVIECQFPVSRLNNLCIFQPLKFTQLLELSYLHNKVLVFHPCFIRKLPFLPLIKKLHEILGLYGSLNSHSSLCINVNFMFSYQNYKQKGYESKYKSVWLYKLI